MHSLLLMVSEDGSLETGIWFDDEPPEELMAHRGSELVLNCSVSTSAELPDANVTWLKDGRPLLVGSEQRRVRIRSADGSLVIRRLQARSDNGRYQCLAAVHALGALLSAPTTVRVAGASCHLCSSKRHSHVRFYTSDPKTFGLKPKFGLEFGF